MNLTDSTGAPRPVDERRLAGRVALVTGGSSGIGWAISQLLATNGATVAVVASGSHTKAIEAADRISETGGAAHPFVADVTDTNAVNDLVHDISDTLGASPSIVVNAAGLWRPTPLDEIDDHALDRLVDTNLKGTIRVTAAAAPHMVARGFGHIVNISSVVGSNPSPGYSVYAATKAAVNAFTRAAALELAPHGIAVNAIAPGNTETTMNEHIRTASEHAQQLDWIQRITPSQRPFTPPHEIAQVALMLIDGRIKGFHGAVISIDEGRSAGQMR